VWIATEHISDKLRDEFASWGRFIGRLPLADSNVGRDEAGLAEGQVLAPTRAAAIVRFLDGNPQLMQR
jgi:hypothetical protein